MSELQQLVSYDDAAILAQRSPSTIRTWACQGRLTKHRTVDGIRVDMAEVWVVERAAAGHVGGRGRRRVDPRLNPRHVATSQ